jgi:hypothetical protein
MSLARIALMAETSLPTRWAEVFQNLHANSLWILPLVALERGFESHPYQAIGAMVLWVIAATTAVYGGVLKSVTSSPERRQKLLTWGLVLIGAVVLGLGLYRLGSEQISAGQSEQLQSERDARAKAEGELATVAEQLRAQLRERQALDGQLAKARQELQASQQTSQSAKPTAPRKEFIRNLSIALEPDRPVVLTGIAALTTDRLRVFVDYARAQGTGWSEKRRVRIGEIREPVKDQHIDIQLVYRIAREGNDLWWGSNADANEGLYPAGGIIKDTFPVPAIAGHVVIIGPDGSEQTYPFAFLRHNDPKMPLSRFPESSPAWIPQ